MDLIEVDDIGLHALQAGLAGGDEMMARQAAVVRPLAHGKPRLGGDQHAVLSGAAEDFADDLLAHTGGIGIRRVDEIDAVVEAEIDHAASIGDAEVTHGFGPAHAAEGHGAHGDGGNLEAGTAEQSVFHVVLLPFDERPAVRMGRRADRSLVFLHHVAPQVDAAVAGVAVDLLQLLIREGEVVQRIQRIVELLDIARADEGGGDARSRSTQAMAICASDWPRRAAMSFSARTRAMLSSVSRLSSKEPARAARLSAETPFRYLFVSRPCASGEKAMQPVPSASSVPRSSCSTQRFSME